MLICSILFSPLREREREREEKLAMKKESDDRKFTPLTKKIKEEPLSSSIDGNRDDLHLLCDVIHKITDDASSSSSSTAATTAQNLQEIDSADESFHISKPVQITPTKIPSSVINYQDSLLHQQQQQYDDDDDDCVTPQAPQENKNNSKGNNDVISTSGNSNENNINNINNKNKKNKKIRKNLEVRVKFDNKKLKIEEITEADSPPSSSNLIYGTNADKDSFRKQLCDDTIKVYRIRMFRNDARCDRDPMGNLPSKWGIKNGYIACEARILPSHINTPQHIQDFCYSTFPMNAISASSVKQKMTKLFATSLSWRYVHT